MATAPAALLDPVLLARIDDLALLARTVVDGFLAGMHRSPRRGSSLDFAEHRPYQPGDDLRRIDWRAYARTDRFYLKEFEADTNAPVLFALDASGSMDFGSAGVTKFAYARMLVASLAWLSQRQGDRVGLVTFTDGLADVVPASTRHLQLLLHTLGRAHARGPGTLAAATRRLADLATRAGIAVVVTDCYEEPATIGRAIGTLRARGHDVLLFHVTDPAERDLPFDGPRTFEDAETGARLPLRPEALRAKYRAAFAAHRVAVRARLVDAGADYVAVDTDRPLDDALRAYLDLRLATGRVR